MTCTEAIEIAKWAGPTMLFMVEFGMVAGFILGRITHAKDMRKDGSHE